MLHPNENISDEILFKLLFFPSFPPNKRKKRNYFNFIYYIQLYFFKTLVCRASYWITTYNCKKWEHVSACLCKSYLFNVLTLISHVFIFERTLQPVFQKDNFLSVKFTIHHQQDCFIPLCFIQIVIIKMGVS